MIKIENVDVFGWEAVKGFEEYYRVSPTGAVYSVRSNRLIKPFRSRMCGYIQFEFNVDGVATKHLAHRLVADAYLPNPSNLPCVNHKDGDKLNNCVENLEWCTYAENMKHAFENNLAKTKGSNNPASKLTEDQVRCIKSTYRKGDVEHGSVALGKRFGVDHKTILAIVNGRTWRDVQ